MDSSPRLGAIGRVAQRRPFTSFLVVTFSLSWGVWVGVAALGLGTSLGVFAVIPGAFGPPVAALWHVWATGGSPRRWLRTVAGVRGRRRWYAVALLLPVLVVGVGTLALVATGRRLIPSVLPLRLVAFFPTVVFMALLGGGQEELGWRGFALPRLEHRTTPLTAALALGIIWAAWHLPLFYVPGASQYGASFAPYAVGVVGLSVVFTWLFNRSASVAVATVLHGSYNASLVLYPLPAGKLTDGAGEVLTFGAVAVWALALALVVATRANLGYDPERLPAVPE